MKKYEIVKNKLDSYTLKYKDKSFEFHSDITIKAKMQGVYKTARLRMIKELSSEGISLKSFTMEEKKGGKTYYDNTNKKELEQIYIEEETANMFNNICDENFGMPLMDLIIDIGLEENEIEDFSTELAQAFNGIFPS